MTMLEILTNPIIWIIIIISGTLIMYYILSKSTPNDRKICDTDEEIPWYIVVPKDISEEEMSSLSDPSYTVWKPLIKNLTILIFKNF